MTAKDISYFWFWLKPVKTFEVIAKAAVGGIETADLPAGRPWHVGRLVPICDEFATRL